MHDPVFGSSNGYQADAALALLRNTRILRDLLYEYSWSN